VVDPFDDYGAPEDDPSGMSAAAPPSYGESFMINAREGFGGLRSAYQSFIASRTIKRAETEGVAQPGSSPFEGKVSQTEADMARGALAIRRMEKAQYDTFESDGFIGKTVGLMGGLGGALLAPENFASAGGAVAARVAQGATQLGASTVAGRIIGTGVEAGAVNASLDAAGQGLEIGAGLEDHYSPLRTALAFGAGAALGSGMAGVAEVLTRRAELRQAETARVDQYIAKRDAELRGEGVEPVPPSTSPEPLAVSNGEALAIAQAPNDAHAAEGTAVNFEGPQAPVPGDAGPLEGNAPTTAVAKATNDLREPPPLSAKEVLADLPAALEGGSIDVKRFSAAPTSEELDALIKAGRVHEEAEADKIFGVDAERAKKLMRSNAESSYKRLEALVEKYGDEAERLVYGSGDAKIVNTTSLNSLRDRIINIEYAVDEAAKGDLTMLSRELAWVGPKLPDINAAPSTHSDLEREAVLALARAVDEMQAKGVAPEPVLRVAVEYTGQRVGGDADDAHTLLARLSEFAKRYMLSEPEAVSPSAPRAAAPKLMAQSQKASSSVQAMASRSAVMNQDARFPDRHVLAGEAEKPKELPADIKPEEIQNFRVTNEMRSIATALGRKLEVDSRFNIRGAEGEYKLVDGVLRIRREGDFEVFSHEFGHAIDQHIRNNPEVSAEWRSLLDQHAEEIQALDANTDDPAAKTVSEGVAEFIRQYINNPGYAKASAPNFAADFLQFLRSRDPELLATMDRAARVSQIDSGLPPMAAMEAMIVPPSNEKGFNKYKALYEREGIGFSLGRLAADANAAIFGESFRVRQYVDELKESQFKKTGEALPFVEWDDPYKRYRNLPGAMQSGIDALYFGPRSYFDNLGPRTGPSLYDGVAHAMGGDISRIDRDGDPLAKAFSGYLVARRSRALYGRWRNGDLQKPPVGRSEADVIAAIADYERSFPQFVEGADQVFGFNRAMWDRKFEAGLVSKDIHDAVVARGDDYVPFQREILDREERGNGGGSNTMPNKTVHKIKGSTRNIIDPIHSIIADAVQTERVIALNDSRLAMVKLAESGGEFAGRFLERIPAKVMKATSVDLVDAIKNAARKNGADKEETASILHLLEDLIGEDMTATVFKATDTVPGTGERIIFVWKNGERIPYKVGSDEISKAYFDTISAMTASERDILFKVLGRGNALFSQMVTNAPSFGIVNLIMDNMSRIFVARNTGILGRIPFAGVAAGLWVTAFDREFTRAYNALGGIRGGVASHALREIQEGEGLSALTMRPRGIVDKLNAIPGQIAELARNPGQAAIVVAESPWHALTAIFKGIVGVIEATETIGRLGQAKIVESHLRKQGVGSEAAKMESIFEARDLLDYDNKGFGVRQASRFLVFLNANLQGIRRANDVLVGTPIQAAISAYKRGGYEALDGDMKKALSDSVAAYGMLALVSALSVGYYYQSQDKSWYQKQSEYMKRRYWMFHAGTSENGDDNIIALPKPFDMPGAIFSAIEFSLDAVLRGDPASWARARKAFAEGFTPRMFSGVAEFAGANPTLKLAAELGTGMKLPFDDRSPVPIIPGALKARPPEAQWNASTSWVARSLGEKLGWSPMMVDHIMTSVGATTARDLNSMFTAYFGNNPNMTPADAWRQALIGRIYRRDMASGGGMREAFDAIMGKDHGSYIQAANAYKDAHEKAIGVDPEEYYNNANDTGKTIMTLRAFPFKPEVRQLHPLERATTVTDILNAVRRDLVGGQVEIVDKSHKRGVERNYIEVAPPVARSIINTLSRSIFEEYRNGLSAVGERGYESFPIIDTKANFSAIQALSPEIAAEIQKRLKKAHVLPIDGVIANWPETKRRLLQDEDKAHLSDLRARAALHGL
jgi:hypothetical protein